MTAMKRRKYRKRKETKRKYLQTLCDQKVERKKGTMASKTGRKNCNNVAVKAKAK